MRPRSFALGSSGSGQDLNWKPKRWIATLLGLFSGPLALLYVGQWKRVLAFVATFCAIGLAFIFNIIGHSENDLFRIAYWVAGPVVAYKCAKSAKPGIQPWFARWYSLVGIAAISYGAVTFTRTFLYEPLWILADEMRPTTRREAHVLLRKRPGELHRSDIIVFNFPADDGNERVGRVVGVPGDRVTYAAKHLLVNGGETRVRRLEDFLDMPMWDNHRQRYLNQLDGVSFDTLVKEGQTEERPLKMDAPKREACVQTELSLECTVPPGHYFVIGDNRDDSEDSRQRGFVRPDMVIGKVVKVFEPLFFADD